MLKLRLVIGNETNKQRRNTKFFRLSDIISHSIRIFTLHKILIARFSIEMMLII